MTRRRIRIDLAYDGTDFAGWQWQKSVRTVQGTVEEALTRLGGDLPVRLRAAGRTDAGVHARQQVADCLIATRFEDDRLAHALGKLLPDDVRPRRVRTVSAAFNSMHHALRKTYRYRIDRSRYGDPMTARYALHYPHALDRRHLDEGLGRLIGRRDWSGFTDSRCRIRERVRDLVEATYHERDGAGHFTFTADGFLTYMVRNLVGTLLEVGSGALPPATIESILSSGDRRLAAATAPAKGLCLWEVRYADGATDEGDRPREASER